MSIPPALIPYLPTLLQLGVDTIFRSVALWREIQAANPDMDWDQFVAQVEAISIGDADELIQEGQGGTPPQP